jgi:hypothetical protein
MVRLSTVTDLRRILGVSTESAMVGAPPTGRDRYVPFAMEHALQIVRRLPSPEPIPCPRCSVTLVVDRGAAGERPAPFTVVRCDGCGRCALIRNAPRAA